MCDTPADVQSLSCVSLAWTRAWWSLHRHLATKPVRVSVLAQARGVGEEALGASPHMVRGALAGCSQLALRGAAFSRCTACSPAVVGALRSGGWSFLLQALRVRCPSTCSALCAPLVCLR